MTKQTNDMTASHFNGTLDPALVTAFRGFCAQRIQFEPAGPKETLLGKDRAELRDLADGVIAVGSSFGQEYWVMQNDWHGFPDPAEFVFVAFGDGGKIIALGYFDDWPSAWSRPKTH